MPALLLVLMGVVVVPKVAAKFGGDDDANADYVLKPVVRGPMRIAVTARGTIDSMNNITLKSEVEGSAKIIMIVPEGTAVKAPVRAEAAGIVKEIREVSEKERLIIVQPESGDPVAHPVTMSEYTRVRVQVDQMVETNDILAGDLICELDSASMREQIKKQEIQVTTAEAALAQAIENLEIQKNLNESDEATAALNVTLAELDLKKFKEGEFQQQTNENAGQITLAQEELARAQEKYEFSKRLAKKGYKSQNELEADRIAVTQAEIKLSVAKEKQAVLQKFTYQRTIAELEATAKENRLEAERVKRKGKSALVQNEADVTARKLTAEVEREQYERLSKQIQAAQIYAPQAGEVVYANTTSRRGSEATVIDEGTTVHERQSIIKLPDLANMKVDAKIHESQIRMVSTGMPVQIQVDAQAGEIFNGELSFVASVPSSTNWMNQDLKEYTCTITINETGERIRKLRPGLTANVEIVAKHREDVLQIPVQCVISVGDKRVAFVKTKNGAERRDLTTGDENDVAIEVLKGLEEGDEVVQNPRTHFADEITALESELEDEENKKQLENRKALPKPSETNQRRPQSQPKQQPAQPQQPSADDAFKGMDKDGDGKITKEEAPEQMKNYFDRVDTNGDGSIDKGEWSSMMQRMQQMRQGGGG